MPDADGIDMPGVKQSAKSATSSRKAAKKAAKKTPGKKAASARTAKKGAAKAVKKKAAKKAASASSGAKKRRKASSERGPSAVTQEVDAAVLEFIDAIDRYKRERARPFPTWSEVLHVLRSLGYRKVD